MKIVFLFFCTKLHLCYHIHTYDSHTRLYNIIIRTHHHHNTIYIYTYICFNTCVHVRVCDTH